MSNLVFQSIYKTLIVLLGEYLLVLASLSAMSVEIDGVVGGFGQIFVLESLECIHSIANGILGSKETSEFGQKGSNGCGPNQEGVASCQRMGYF